jgi:SAM-dependent methyltransferase
MTRWSELTGGASGAAYAARIAALAATGQDMHGEATFCAALAIPPARVLDAGCGTGRVAIRLAELGYRCVGTDLDDSMLAVAREAAPDLTWISADLATLELADTFDLIVAAGNVVPLLAPGTLSAAIANLARHLAPDGLLVTGFGLDAAHLPTSCPVTSLAEYDDACAAGKLSLGSRYATWGGDPFRGESGGYVVSVHHAADVLR